jgi:hypothetical protein
MKTFFLIASLTTACATAFAFPDYEPFSDATSAGGSSYGIGENLVGQTNASYAAFSGTAPSWYLRTGAGTSGTQPTIISAGLSYSGLTTSGGGAAGFGPNGDNALMNLSTSTTGIIPSASRTVYFSYLLQLTDVTGLSATGTRITGVDQLQSNNNGPGLPAMGGIVMARNDGGTGFNLGIDGGGKGGTAATIQWDSTSYSAGNTLFIVGSYDFGATTSTGFGELWINPSSDDFGAASAPTADLTSSGNSTSLARVASLILLQDVDGPTGVLDDLRIGTSWADVTPAAPVPEPSPLALGLLSVAAWIAFIRFRRVA